MEGMPVAHSDRLVSVSEGMEIVGVGSPTTYYKLIHEGQLPPLIKRGVRSFHLHSDLMAYLHRLVAQRGMQSGIALESSQRPRDGRPRKLVEGSAP